MKTAESIDLSFFNSQLLILIRNRYEYDTFVTVRKSSVVNSTDRLAIN